MFIKTETNIGNYTGATRFLKPQRFLTITLQNKKFSVKNFLSKCLFKFSVYYHTYEILYRKLHFLYSKFT